MFYNVLKPVLYKQFPMKKILLKLLPVNCLTCLLLIIATSLLSFSTQAQIITTIAGNGIANITGDGGPAVNAEIYGPYSVTVYAWDNVYFSDDNSIRKINGLTGIINTLVDTFNMGGFTDDGEPAKYAQVYMPYGLTLDNSGNIYIADYGNERIRKVDSTTGIITTLAGNGMVGCTGTTESATSINAYLNNPYRLAVDAHGNLYIIAGSNFIEEVIASTDVIQDVIGRGGCGSAGGYSGDGGLADTAGFNLPSDIAIDAAGNIYIADLGNYRVRKITASTGIIATIAGNGTFGYSGDGGLAVSAELLSPKAVAVDKSGNVYIVDEDAIRKVSAATGIITRIAGVDTTVGSNTYPVPGYSGDGGLATLAKINSPNGIAVDGAGNVYIADNGNHRIRKITPGITGIENVPANIDVSVYPNPCTGQIAIKLTGGNYLSLKIFDALGREIYSEPLNEVELNQNLHINLSNAANGIYFLQVLSQTETICKRVVVQK
jgi:sugar lactone lactonase YvrE